MQRIAALAVFFSLFGCDANEDDVDPADSGPQVDGSPASPTALRLSFPDSIQSVVCNGRELACTPRGDRCTLDLEANVQGWTDTAVLCQGVEDEPLFAPLVTVVFKDGLPIWTPNLDAAGTVKVDARATALATAFLSPNLVVVFPETARAMLAQAAASPYLQPLTDAVAARDQGTAAAALPQLVADVVAQATLQQGLSDASRSLGMSHIDVERTSGYITLDSRLGTPVDHICVVYALDVCLPESEVALAAVEPSDSFPKSEIGQTFVGAKSYFSIQALAKAALGELFGGFLSGPDLESFRLEPGRVHDIQCYSGALGLGDEADARADAILVSAEPDGTHFTNLARVANLVSMALDTLRLFVDFDAFGDSGQVAKSAAICATQALGPTLNLADGTTREEWFVLLKLVQTCAIKQLGIVLAKRGAFAVAAWVFDFAGGGGGGWVGKATRAGMIADRVVGMVYRMSPIQRQLIAHAVDFEACAPCMDQCPAVGGFRCVDAVNREVCGAGAEACLEWSPSVACAESTVCESGDCLACGEVGERCCDDATCSAGNRCDGGACVVGCRDECPANGVTQCADRASDQVCGEHDGDACLEWGPSQECAVGELCEETVCAPPSCLDECDEGAEQCTADGSETQACGNCDMDGCREWCPGTACAADFVCMDATCECDQLEADLPDAWPGEVLAPLADDGSAHVRRNSLWPERDNDVLSAYVSDTRGNTIRPTVRVNEVAAGLVYDVCVAFACDPNVNNGEPTHVDCGDALRTNRNGQPACCRLAQDADSEVAIDVNCTAGGLRDDSGTAYAFVEATQGTQCAPPVRITLIGGND